MIQDSMLSGSLVTTAWRSLALRLEVTASRYGRYLRTYLISGHGQPTVGSPPVWWVEGLTAPHSKEASMLRNVTDSLKFLGL
jgi:hypothetical protein